MAIERMEDEVVGIRFVGERRRTRNLKRVPLAVLLGTVLAVGTVAVSPAKCPLGFPLEGDDTTAYADEAQEEIEWKRWNDYSWYVDQNGTLVISSEKLWSSDVSIPWSESVRITSARFEPGTKGNCNGLFHDLPRLKTVDFTNFDTSQTIGMHDMFRGCSSLESLDLSSFDTSRVEATYRMFQGCSSLESLDLSSFDTSKVDNMSSMFEGCSSLRALDLSSFDTSNVYDMESMFKGCSSLETLDLSTFDTSGVGYESAGGYRRDGSMISMFEGCSSLASVDLSSFNTSKVRDMNSMFEGCSSLETLDLSSFDTSGVCWHSGIDVYDGMSRMFAGCSSLKSVDLSSFDTHRVASMYCMFQGCSSLESLDLSSFRTSGAYSLACMFQGCSSLRSLDLSSFSTSNVLDMRGMFSGCSSLADLDASGFDTSRVGSRSDSIQTFSDGSFEDMFSGCSSLVSVALPDFYTQKGASMKGMFRGCSSLAEIDLSDLRTVNIESMESMFEGCSSLESVDLSTMNLTNVRNLSYMFQDCSSLISVDLSSLALAENSPSLDFAFRGCGNLTTLYSSEAISDDSPLVCFKYESLPPVSGGLGTSIVDVSFLSKPSWDRYHGWCVQAGYLRPDEPGKSGILTLRKLGTTAISDVSAATMLNQSYTGKAFTPAVVLNDGGKTLVEGSDYRIHSYENNVNAGTASVIVEGLGSYSGYKRVTFTIAPISLSGAQVSIAQTNFTYDGTAKEPVVTVKIGGKTLAAGEDYDVSYASNASAGTAKATVTGEGNYAGTCSATFRINPASLSGASVELAQTSYTYDGTAKKPGVTVKLGGKTLMEGADYAVSYSANVAVGTARATVTGKGNYTGTCSKSFTIEKGSQGSNQGSGSAGLRPGEGTPVAAPAGSWRQDSTGWWYAYAKGGYPANSWAYIGGKWYRFGASGYMLTGWALVDGKWYYLDPSGAMAEGWRYVGGEWYWLRPVSGAMVTGWVDVDGTWYWMRGSGAMDHSGWLSVGGTWYWLEDSGAMATGWKHVGGEWYYLKASGAMATGWAQVGGAWYYLDGSGAMATGWRHVGGAWYYLHGSGAMAANAWVGGVYWVGPSGAMATSSWVDGGRYYVGPDGVWQS